LVYFAKKGALWLGFCVYGMFFGEFPEKFVLFVLRETSVPVLLWQGRKAVIQTLSVMGL
jgi:hypothetical protein